MTVLVDRSRPRIKRGNCNGHISTARYERLRRLESVVRVRQSSKPARDINSDSEILEPPYIDGVAGDGAVHISLEDLVIWDRFWVGNDLVSDEYLRETTTGADLTNGRTPPYGFGWLVSDDRVGHSGTWLGARAVLVRMDPGLTVAVLSNRSGEVDSIADSIITVMS